jgi:hypothetical protein
MVADDIKEAIDQIFNDWLCSALLGEDDQCYKSSVDNES